MSNTVKLENKYVGFIRWKGFIPIILLLTLLIVYFLFFFDFHLKTLIERMGSSLNQAQVNLASLRTSFLKCELEIKGIEVANHLHPMKNRVEIDRVHFQFLFGPLLRKKLIIEDSVVQGIHYGTDRRFSGALVNLPEISSSGPSFVDRVSANLYKQLRGQLDQSPLKHLGQLTTGLDLRGQLSGVERELTSLKRINEVKENLNSLNPNDHLKELPKPTLITGYRERVSKLAQVKSTLEIQRSIQEVQKIKSEVTSQTQAVEATYTRAKSELDKIREGLSSIDTLINQDVQRIRSKLKLPRLDIPDFSRLIFGPKMLATMERMTYWIDLARRRMPKGSPKGKVLYEEQERAKGTTMHFGKVASYPGFLLRHAEISSDISEDSRRGVVQATLAGVTSNPSVYGKPMTFTLEGAFPASHIEGLSAQLLIDHTGDENKESVQLSVQSFPISDLKLSDSPDLNFGIKQSKSKLNMKVLFTEHGIQGKIQTHFWDIEYLLLSRIKRVEEILGKVVAEVARFDLEATIEGRIDNLSFDARSDLGEKISSGLQNEFKHQVAAIEDSIKKHIHDQLGGKRRDIEARMRETQARLISPIENQLKDLQEVQKSADHSIARLENEGKRLARQEAEKQQQRIQKQVESQTEALKRSVKIPGL